MFKSRLRPTLNTWFFGLIIVGLAAFTGCGNGNVEVRGTVTVDGQPIDEGSISLEPADGQGPTTGGLIKAGKYELSGNAAATPGKKIVRIVGLRQTGKMIPAGPPAPKGTLIPELIQCVPSHYNDKSRLHVDVTPGKANTHDFQLDSKAPPPKAASLLHPSTRAAGSPMAAALFRHQPHVVEADHVGFNSGGICAMYDDCEAMRTSG